METVRVNSSPNRANGSRRIVRIEPDVERQASGSKHAFVLAHDHSDDRVVGVHSLALCDDSISTSLPPTPGRVIRSPSVPRLNPSRIVPLICDARAHARRA